MQRKCAADLKNNSQSFHITALYYLQCNIPALIAFYHDLYSPLDLRTTNQILHQLLKLLPISLRVAY